MCFPDLVSLVKKEKNKMERRDIHTRNTDKHKPKRKNKQEKFLYCK